MAITLSRAFRSEREIVDFIRLTYLDQRLPAFTIQSDLVTLAIDPQATRNEVMVLIRVLMHTRLLKFSEVQHVA